MQIFDLQGSARVRSRAAWFVACAFLAGCSSRGAPPMAAEHREARRAAPAEARIDALDEAAQAPEEQGSQLVAPVNPDWENSVVATATNADGDVVLMMHAVIEADWLFVVVDQIQRRDELWYNLFLDTDNDPATGQKSGIWSSSSGAEMAVSGGMLRRYASRDGSERDWGAWTEVISVIPEFVDSNLGGTARYFQIPLSAMEATAEAGLGLGFQSVYEDGVNSDSDFVPVTPTFLRIAPEGSAKYDVDNCRYGEAPPRPQEWLTPVCPDGYPSEFPEPVAEEFGVGRGTIIPAYIPLGMQAQAQWSAILDGADNLPSIDGVQDYWVAINGPDPGGPPDAFADWKPYKTYWDQLTDKPAIKVFGYVYSCIGKCKTEGKLRPLQAVMEDITRWICGYPELDGIWIDEFYPQYELTTSTSGIIIPNVEENGELTPYDRCFIRWDGSNNDSYDVRPAGGYFDQLTAWIRATYPHLKIIGNAGGNLISTLPSYAGLVDVFVGYENSYNRAFNVDGTDVKKLKVLGASQRGRFGQLALFHETSAQVEMPRVIEEAWKLGYTHVYASDGRYDGGEGNAWGSVATYLEAELPQIFR